MSNQKVLLHKMYIISSDMHVFLFLFLFACGTFVLAHMHIISKNVKKCLNFACISTLCAQDAY